MLTITSSWYNIIFIPGGSMYECFECIAKNQRSSSNLDVFLLFFSRKPVGKTVHKYWFLSLKVCVQNIYLHKIGARLNSNEEFCECRCYGFCLYDPKDFIVFMGYFTYYTTIFFIEFIYQFRAAA